MKPNRTITLQNHYTMSRVNTHMTSFTLITLRMASKSSEGGQMNVNLCFVTGNLSKKKKCWRKCWRKREVRERREREGGGKERGGERRGKEGVKERGQRNNPTLV